mmetsp:Transcript_20054/g.50142  ORF Transcript_20054/g.50142 Transcript_20054/m.50142 type:complete len:262 (-) Transcript_20054:608-1393(-)
MRSMLAMTAFVLLEGLRTSSMNSTNSGSSFVALRDCASYSSSLSVSSNSPSSGPMLVFLSRLLRSAATSFMRLKCLGEHSARMSVGRVRKELQAIWTRRSRSRTNMTTLPCAPSSASSSASSSFCSISSFAASRRHPYAPFSKSLSSTSGTSSLTRGGMTTIGLPMNFVFLVRRTIRRDLVILARVVESRNDPFGILMRLPIPSIQSKRSSLPHTILTQFLRSCRSLMTTVPESPQTWGARILKHALYLAVSEFLSSVNSS